jgi:pimeloyl-ACP methyl ester carboxylesterase
MLTLIVLTMLNATPVDPLDAIVAASRDQLKSAGLTRKTTDDGSVYWTGGGSKESKTLVLLHGVNDQAGTWAAVVPELKKDFRLIVPDLAGHGESEPKTGPIMFDNMVARVDAILAKENASKVTIAGNSMGGWVAMLYAFDHADKVERLVLEDSSGIAWDLSGVPLAPKNREEADKMMKAVHGPETKTPEVVLDALLARKNPPMTRIGLQDVMIHIVDARLKELKMPVTILWGRDDGILSLDYAKALTEKIPGATLQIIDGAAHIPHRQQPARFVKCLKASC